MLDNLGEMVCDFSACFECFDKIFLFQEIAQSIISSGTATDEEGNAINVIDSNFLSLGLSSMTPVVVDSHEWNGLNEYVTSTHGQTHYFRTDMQYAYRVERYLN